jgi:hypothetical protein
LSVAGPSQTLTADGEGHEWQKRKLAAAAQSLPEMMDGGPGGPGRMEMLIFPKAQHFLLGHRASGNRVRTNHFTFSLFYFFLLIRNIFYSLGMIDQGNCIKVTFILRKNFHLNFNLLLEH